MAEKEKSKKSSKHLFGSGEKSDFIVNMKPESAQKLCGVYSIIALLILTIAAVPYYFVQNVKIGTDSETGRYVYLNEKYIYVIFAALLVAGFAGFLIFLIANMKKIVELRTQKSLVLAPIILVMTLISCLASSDIYTTIYGQYERPGGLLTIIAYWGFFCIGMIVSADKWRGKLADLIVGLGVFEALAGIVQVIPVTAKIVPNYFDGLYLRPGVSTENAGEYLKNANILTMGIYQDKRVASGFLGNPHALAAVLSVAFAFAMIGYLFDESKKRRVFYGVSAPVMAAASFLSCTITGIIGIAAAALTVFVIAAAKKGSALKALGVIIVCGGAAAALYATGAAQLLDEKIIATDNICCTDYASENFIQYHKEASAGQHDDNIYSLLQSDGLEVIKNKPLLGTGPDNVSGLTSYGAYLDRSYNEFIDMAASRGLITAGVYVIFLIVSIRKGIKAVKDSEKGKWIAAAALAAVIAYTAQSFFNISAITSSPFMWISLGLLWSFKTAEPKEQID